RPTAAACPVSRFTAIADGSSTTIPLPRTLTRVLTVPRSIATPARSRILPAYSRKQLLPVIVGLPSPTVTHIPIAADINDRNSRHQSADPARARTWPACLGHPAATPPWSQNLGPPVPWGRPGPAPPGTRGPAQRPGDLWPSARAGLARQPGSRNKAYGGTEMRVVIVYESMFGNTHLIADAIAKGLAPGNVVTVVPAAQAGREVLDRADLLVVGGPTHVHGMSRTRSRASAVEMAHKEGSHLTLDAH